MKSSLKSLLAILLITSGFIACEKDKGPVIIKPDTHGPGQSADTIISYSIDIQPLFDEHCILCHNQSHPFLDLRDAYSYNQLLFIGHSAPYVIPIDPPQSYLIGRLQGVEYAIMPPNLPPLSVGAIDTILIWIRQGAMNN